MELERIIEIIKADRDKTLAEAMKCKEYELDTAYHMNMYSVRTYDSVLKLLKGE